MSNEKRSFWDRSSVIFFLLSTLAFGLMAAAADKYRNDLLASQQELKEAKVRAKDTKKDSDLYVKTMSLCGVRFQGHGNEKTVTYMYNCVGQTVKLVYTADGKWVESK